MIILGETIQREKAEKICKTLSAALGRTIRLQDVDEIHLQSIERPERRKSAKPEQDGDQDDHH
jgi:hypothetical protein